MLTGVVVDYFDRLNCEIVNCSSLEFVNIRGDGDANLLFENQSNRFFSVCADLFGARNPCAFDDISDGSSKFWRSKKRRGE